MAEPRDREDQGQQPAPTQPYDASDPEQVNAARREEGRRLKARRGVLKGILRTPAGRAWLYEMLNMCHIYHTSFIPGQPDASAFREGERNVGLKMAGEASAADPENYLLMVREGNGANG